ncbi:MAG: UDP-3-O-(3-hydroxymyristoyl)glucosamine N-acyltransferase [bacterium]|nr:UDP-3-O-(3-hydroxymyristoyl)glucosamine N-acyltransferase [bacterium]
MKLLEIAEVINGKIEGDDNIEITGVGKIQEAEKNQITFLSNPLYEKYFDNTKAGAVIVSENHKVIQKRPGVSIVRVADPYLSFLKLLEMFDTGNDVENGIADNCVIGEETSLGKNVSIGNFVSIGKNCVIGDNVRIHSNCSIENKVSIGDNCIIHPNVSIYKGCEVGNNVIIHSGAVIGTDGFGYAKEENGSYKKIPQTGNVVIEDNAEIGANCCIDRATMGETRICKGVKLDDQITIAHNVYIGENTVIAAQAGIAGSTKIGKRCMIGGQAGIVGHIEICDDVIIGASVGVSKSITKPGIYTGYRAMPVKDNLRSEVRIQNLQKLEEKIKILESKILK